MSEAIEELVAALKELVDTLRESVKETKIGKLVVKLLRGLG